jgi:hypothetical protein
VERLHVLRKVGLVEGADEGSGEHKVVCQVLLALVDTWRVCGCGGRQGGRGGGGARGSGPRGSTGREGAVGRWYATKGGRGCHRCVTTSTLRPSSSRRPRWAGVSLMPPCMPCTRDQLSSRSPAQLSPQSPAQLTPPSCSAHPCSGWTWPWR